MEDLQRVSGGSPFHYMAYTVESKPVGIVEGWMILTTWGGPLSHQ